MDLGDCYRLLGLRSGASFSDIKLSYRRLAQLYHPDINPDDKKAKEKFIAVTEAYKLLLQVVPQENTFRQGTQSQTVERQETSSRPEPPKKEKPKPKPKPPNVVEIERRLKWRTYEQLQQFLKQKRFPQATALAEALAQRLPDDAEVRQWQAIAYQLWGRSLIADNQPLKARIYLKKALKTDPNNRTLWIEVQRDFERLEQKIF
ncbi:MULTISPECIES: J domain-containing protein [Nostocales]|uniref:DnaJ domain-containing protein n=3 Tax=Nostocales TaxID=1161 RepID=A0A0C1R8M9_9CYAN|nr:J domain-containing protein [Tolypothrix bouteillei]KAF3890699.1 DnaJ domain-containing protein [Tolypothrix bouteillei VB521301]